MVKATEVTAGLAESNGSLLPGLWRDSLHVTYGLTACTSGSAPGPTLGNEYGKTLPFTFFTVNSQWSMVWVTCQGLFGQGAKEYSGSITGCAVRQPRVNGDWPGRWEMSIFDPAQNPHPLSQRLLGEQRHTGCEQFA